MSIEAIQQLQKDVRDLTERCDDISKVIEGFKIDRQSFLKANSKIKPGIGCKVAFDENGLIISREELDQSDIPELSIDHIADLRKMLSDKASRKDLNNISINLDEIFKRRSIEGTGCKINYDKYGVIQSSTDLEVSDIPKLPLDHIEGLDEKLEEIKTLIPKPVSVEEIKKINPGTATKVTYDEEGRVVEGSSLTMDDIPMELITRLNLLESKLPEMVSSTSLEAINKTLSKKANKVKNVKPGTYSKVTVNEDGIITEGKELKTSDLPKLRPEDIDGLVTLLSDKAKHSDVVELISSVSKLTGMFNRIGDITQLKNKVDNVVDKSITDDLYKKINDLTLAVNGLTDNTLILSQLSELQDQINTLNGRVTVLEQKMKN